MTVVQGTAEAAAAARERVLAELREGGRFCLVTHERPDGDALGSLLAMQGVLTALGKDSVMLMAADELPLPHEYRFLDLEGLRHEPPEDLAERTVVFLDCGNIERNRMAAASTAGARILLNIDHHHDNTRFGTVDLVDPGASCTAEIVWDLMRELGVSPSLQVAEALYVGLVTDTGRFMYENTGPRAHEMAGELIAAGVDVHAIYRRLYEGMPEAKLDLLALALGRVQRFDGGVLTMASLSRADFDSVGAAESYSEGIIDHLRSVAGTKVAALSREVSRPAHLDGEAPEKKISLRSTDGEVDVSAMARAGGGGGHRQAAGFSSTMPDDRLVAFLREQLALQLGERADGANGAASGGRPT